MCGRSSPFKILTLFCQEWGGDDDENPSKIFAILASLYFSWFFQNKFGDFLIFLNKLEIQDLVSKMADFFNVWRQNWHVTATKIKILGCFTRHVSFIFIASILFEIHGGHDLHPPPPPPPPPRLTNEKKPRQNRVKQEFGHKTVLWGVLTQMTRLTLSFGLKNYS